MIELSCYTTALVGYLDSLDPGGRAADRLAEATRLAIASDVDGGLVFSHHARIDACRLSYCDDPDWASTRAALRDELAATGSVIAVGNTRHLEWAPGRGGDPVPHWLILRDIHDGRWYVIDDFDALTPHGPQRPFRGWLTDERLRIALTPPGVLPPEVSNRDIHALGVAVPAGAPEHFRWLRWSGAPSRATDVLPDHWISDPVAVLSTLAGRFCSDPDALRRHTDDMWAAARHQCHRARRLGASPLVDVWSELPRALRFAADSAARGRDRTGLVRRTFDQLMDAMVVLS